MHIYDQHFNLLYQYAGNNTIPECHEAPLSRQKCIVCQNGDVIIICPKSLQPADMEDRVGSALPFQYYTPPLSHDLKRFPLASDQTQAEAVLRELGLLVSSHGAFLNLDTISVFPQSTVGCDKVRPARWTMGNYSLEDPYSISLPGDERYPERIGLLMFEELCKRSNNCVQG